MENLRKRVDVRLVTNEKKLDKLTSKPTFVSSKIFNENLMAVHKVKETLTLNRPAYVGMCILDLSLCQMSSEDIVNTHDTFMKSFGVELSDDDKRLPYLYWTPKLHKSPVKHRFIAGSSKCTTKQLSSLLTKILTVIKTGLEKYCSIKTSHTGVNNMWILKNSTNLLSSLGHLGVHKATSIQTFDFSTLYTSIPHDLLKSRMNNIINNAFKHKNGATRYTHIKVGRNKSHFTSDPLNGDNKYTSNDICKMIEFLVDNTYTLDLVDSFSDKWLAFLWEQTVPHYWLTCFSIPTKMSFWINS